MKFKKTKSHQAQIDFMIKKGWYLVKETTKYAYLFKGRPDRPTEEVTVWFYADKDEVNYKELK